jgi:hypothetical protein
MRANRPFDADMHPQGAERRAREHTSLGAMPLRAGPLRRYESRALFIGKLQGLVQKVMYASVHAGKSSTRHSSRIPGPSAV